MPDLPTLGGPPKKSPIAKVLVTALLFGGAVGGAYWFGQRSARKDTPPPPAPAPTLQAGTAPAPPGLNAGEAPAVAPPPAAPAPLPPSAIRGASIRIDGPLETSLVAAAGKEAGPALAQVVTRALVWWVQVPGDLRKGDTLDVLYEERVGEEPLVHALRFVSAKTGQTHRAYRYKPAGEGFARYYLPGGDELEERLDGSPLDHYEQITSLLRDGRRHKGVDFKAPVGTPVKATFAGTITRKNWNFRGNGNCLEVTENGGRRKALYLHLSELSKDLKVGQRVVKGQVIAQSGNSGRSFAPHLHYQLMGPSDRVLDPFEQHKTYRARLGADQVAALEAEIRRLDGSLTAAAASAAPTAAAAGN